MYSSNEAFKGKKEECANVAEAFTMEQSR